MISFKRLAILTVVMLLGFNSIAQQNGVFNSVLVTKKFQFKGSLPQIGYILTDTSGNGDLAWRPSTDTANHWMSLIRKKSGTDTIQYFKDSSWQFAFRDSSGGSGGSIPTLQQVFNTEVGGSKFTKNDTILLQSNRMWILDTLLINGAMLNIINKGATGSVMAVGNIGTSTTPAASFSSQNGVAGSFYTYDGLNALGAISTNGKAFDFNSSTYWGGSINSNSNGVVGDFASLYLNANSSTNNDIKPVLVLNRYNNISATDGIGGSVDFRLRVDSILSNRIIWKLTDNTNITSQIIITGVDSAVEHDIFTLSGSGATKLNKYGLGVFTGTPATYPAFDASGKIIESVTPYGGGGSTPTFQQVLTAGSALSTDASIYLSNHMWDIHTGNGGALDSSYDAFMHNYAERYVGGGTRYSSGVLQYGADLGAAVSIYARDDSLGTSGQMSIYPDNIAIYAYQRTGSSKLFTLGDSTSEKLSIYGNGQLQIKDYGLGVFTGTPSTYPAFDVDGKLIESTTPYGSNSIRAKGLFVELPSAAESDGMWQTPIAITVDSLVSVLVGSASPSVTYNIYFGTNRASGTKVFTSDVTCTSTTTGCSNSSGFNDATIPAGSFVWFTTSAQSGTVTQIEITLNYTED